MLRHVLHPASSADSTAAIERARLRVLPVENPEWLRFVRDHPAATAFHEPAWAQMIADCYGYRAFAAVAADAHGGIAAGLPVVRVNPLGTRAKWVSLPFTDHCPPLVTSETARSLLASLFLQRARADRARTAEVRDELAGCPAVDVGVRHVLPLNGDEDAIWRGFHRSQVQRNIRRAEREGVVVRGGDREEDLTEVFYRLHVATRRRQGVPVQPHRFFQLLWRRVIAPGLGGVLVAEHQGTPVAAAVFLSTNHTTIYKFGASDSARWSVRPNHPIFWHAIRAAIQRGDNTFDFGRTDLSNHGLREFKASWGATEMPLRYARLGERARERRMPTADPLAAGRTGRAAGAVIRRAPTWVCRVSGSILYRYAA